MQSKNKFVRFFEKNILLKILNPGGFKKSRGPRVKNF